MPQTTQTSDWWRSAVIYQIYPRSWADANGDGLGDLPGITARLDYLAALGVDAIWISPWYVSPMADAGYDVADYRAIDPIFGTLPDADALIARAHELRLKVIIDLVPNHSSDEHAWFKAALAAGPGSPERDLYHFRDGTGTGGQEPPNNWKSVFGGSAWTRVLGPDGAPEQWYLHLFDTKQPDWNWENPAVRAEFESILRFWFDRGVDGFRVDVAHALIKDPAMPDWHAPAGLLGAGGAADSPAPDSFETEDPSVVLPSAHVTGDDELDLEAFSGTHSNSGPMWDQDRVHEIYEVWRRIADSYGTPDRIFCAEAWVQPVSRAVRYIRDTEMHQAFNFDFLETPWDAVRLVSVIRRSMAAAASVGAPTTWVLSNHDVIRHATRLALPSGSARPNGISADQPQPDVALGLRRARAATAVMLALPGAAYIYQGEELGLPEHTTMPDEWRQDPAFLRTKGTDAPEAGRDGARVPMPWTADGESLGFGPGGTPWLPQPAGYAELSVASETGDPDSTLELYRSMLRLRHEQGLGSGELTWLDEKGNGHADARAGVVRFHNSGNGSGLTVIANVGADEVDLPEGAQVVLASGPLREGRLPRDTTVWLRA